MTYQSKRTLTAMAAGLILAIVYLAYALGQKAPAPEDTKAWALLMLAFIGIGVGAMIVIQILFQILFSVGIAIKNPSKTDKEVERIVSATVVEDERDKLIALKSTHFGYVFTGFGFIACLVTLALGGLPSLALNMLLGTSCLGSLSEGVVSVILYERGV